MGSEGISSRFAASIVFCMFFLVAYVALTKTYPDHDPSVLEADCAVNPTAAGCNRPSFLDMINGINRRAQGNAIRQKKVREELLKEESKRALHIAAMDKKKRLAREKAAEVPAPKHLKSTMYNGLDIGDKKAVDTTMKRLLKVGGKVAVEKKVEEIREQILADSGKIFNFGKKAGFLPPPEALKKLA